jgi:hypothetical protein
MFGAIYMLNLIHTSNTYSYVFVLKHHMLAILLICTIFMFLC